MEQENSGQLVNWLCLANRLMDMRVLKIYNKLLGLSGQAVHLPAIDSGGCLEAAHLAGF